MFKGILATPPQSYPPQESGVNKASLRIPLRCFSFSKRVFVGFQQFVFGGVSVSLKKMRLHASNPSQSCLQCVLQEQSENRGR